MFNPDRTTICCISADSILTQQSTAVAGLLVNTVHVYQVEANLLVPDYLRKQVLISKRLSCIKPQINVKTLNTIALEKSTISNG